MKKVENKNKKPVMNLIKALVVMSGALGVNAFADMGELFDPPPPPLDPRIPHISQPSE